MNRGYIRASVMSISIIVGAVLSGLFRLIVPGTISTTSALQQLPAVPLFALNVMWIVAGLTALIGLLTGKRNVEGAGLILVATSYLAYFLAIVGFHAESAGSVVYILFFAIGAAARAHVVLDADNVILITTREELRQSVRSIR